MDNQCVGVLGASSLVGDSVLAQLAGQGVRVAAYSRQPRPDGPALAGVEWRVLPAATRDDAQTNETLTISAWIAVAPVWVLPEWFAWLQAVGVRRIVALSSTSRFVKAGSSVASEQAVAQRLAEGEARLKTWAESNGVEWVVLRPTLIYGKGRDQNVGEIARFIRRFGFFPLFGEAKGLRQPIHADDVAAACVSALQQAGVVNQAYNITGGETLSYRAMVGRIFVGLQRKPRLATVPLWLFRLAVSVLRRLPRYRHWTVAMAERMNQDLCFDHSAATRDFGFAPRPFQPFD